MRIEILRCFMINQNVDSAIGVLMKSPVTGGAVPSKNRSKNQQQVLRDLKGLI